MKSENASASSKDPSGFSLASFDFDRWIRERLTTLPIDTIKVVLECSIKLYKEVGLGCIRYIVERPPEKVYVEQRREKTYSLSVPSSTAGDWSFDWILQCTQDLAVEYPDEVFILDWKTFRGDPEKHVKYKRLSMQPNVYAEFYRGTRKRLDGRVEQYFKKVHFKFYSIQVTTKEIVVTPREPRSMFQDLVSVAGQIRYLQESRQGLNFPTNPDSCGKYGRECPHYSTCAREPWEIPGETHDFPIRLRHSNLTEWYACPERYRRWGESDDESEESELGSYIHDLVGALMALSIDVVTLDVLITSYQLDELRRFVK